MKKITILFSFLMLVGVFGGNARSKFTPDPNVNMIKKYLELFDYEF